MSVREYAILYPKGRGAAGGSVVGGGNVLLSVPQHALDASEHTVATEIGRYLATVAHSGLFPPLSGNSSEFFAGDGTWQLPAIAALGWFNVRDFGAMGDGVTNDTAAINLAIAALIAAGGGVLYYPWGEYLVTATLDDISVSCLVLGVGWTGAGTPQSVIAFTSTSTSLFTVSEGGCHFKDLGLAQTGGTATAGAAITYTDCRLATFDHVFFSAFFIGIDAEDSWMWTAQRCYFQQIKKYGIKVRNTTLPDTGDWSVLNCGFGNPSVAGDAAIRVESSGGGRIIGNKVNGAASGSDRFAYGIDVAMATGVGTSVLLIEGNSLENVTTDAIRIAETGTGTYGLINIIGNQCGLYGNNAGFAVNLSGSGISLVNIAHNTWNTDGTARAAVSVTDATSVHIGPNIINTFNAEYTNSGGRLIDSRGYRMHHVLPTGYTPSGLVTGGNIGINGGTVAQQIVIPHLMILDTLRYKNLDTATARAIEFGLFQDEGSANAMCIAKGSDSFTPVAASNRTPQWTSAPITVYPGTYWFVVRNTGGATNFQFSFLVANATTNIGLVQIQSKTLAGALPAVGATLDLSGSWTRTSLNSMAFALIGRVFGEAAVF